MKGWLLLLFVVAMASIVISCAPQQTTTEVDILSSLPDYDYQTVLWFSPKDYLASEFVSSFKADAGWLVPIISQSLGFNPEKITERYGFALSDCQYVAVFLYPEGEFAVIASTLEENDIADSMRDLLGYEFTEESFEGYYYYHDSEVGRGFFNAGRYTIVGETELLAKIIENQRENSSVYNNEILIQIKAKQDSAAISSVPVAAIDEQQFANQLAKFELDEATVTNITGSVAAISYYEGAFQLSDAVRGIVKMRCASADEAATLSAYFTEKYPEFSGSLASRAVSQAKNLGGLFNFTEEDVMGLLNSFSFAHDGENLIVNVNLEWKMLKPIFSQDKRQ
jgi:hypothetical protein